MLNKKLIALIVLLLILSAVIVSKMIYMLKPNSALVTKPTNPYATWSDLIPVRLKIFWKERVAPRVGKHHHDLIIPQTKNHAAWILGAQPSEFSIKELGKDSHQIQIINMLTSNEKLSLKNKKILIGQDRVELKFDNLPWFDHSTLSTATGKNQTISAMRFFQNHLYPEFNQAHHSKIFYCHCMAGKARSLLETLAFIYFYPEQKKLFDFSEAGWNKIKITAQQKQRLQDAPTLIDLLEFIKLQRPQIKKLAKMESSKVGFLGLMTLSKTADNLEFIAAAKLSKLYQIGSEIGLLLKAPLDFAFRDREDRKLQEENLVKVYRAYQKRNLNLLLLMVTPPNEEIDPEKYQATAREPVFFERFIRLTPSEQARLAILMQYLKKQEGDLTLLKNPLDYALVALTKPNALTSGDQVELLRAFGYATNLRSEEITSKILYGNKVDRYNAADQLQELTKVIQTWHLKKII